MMNKEAYLILCLLFLVSVFSASAQDNLTEDTAQRPDRLYSLSGIGFSIPIGQTAEFFEPKVSTTLGLNLGVGKKGFFLYPKISLHAFKYDEQVTDPGYSTKISNGRATTYLLNLALGYRKMMNNFSYYGFIGGGGGFLLTPQVKLNADGSNAALNNKANAMAMIESGLGLEYRLGKVSVFLESSFTNGLISIQDRQFNTVPICIGIKPNLSSLIHAKK